MLLFVCFVLSSFVLFFDKNPFFLLLLLHLFFSWHVIGAILKEISVSEIINDMTSNSAKNSLQETEKSYIVYQHQHFLFFPQIPATFSYLPKIFVIFVHWLGGECSNHFGAQGVTCESVHIRFIYLQCRVFRLFGGTHVVWSWDDGGGWGVCVWGVCVSCLWGGSDAAPPHTHKTTSTAPKNMLI